MHAKTFRRDGQCELFSARVASHRPASGFWLRLLGGLRKHPSEVLSLLRVRLHLFLRVPSLNLEVLLEVARPGEFAGALEPDVHVLLGIAQGTRLDFER